MKHPESPKYIINGKIFQGANISFKSQDTPLDSGTQSNTGIYYRLVLAAMVL